MNDTAATRRMIALGIAAAVLSCLFVLSFGYAQHSPRPHGVRIDVVAPAGVAEQVAAALGHAAPGGFMVRPVTDVASARRRLREMRSDGALVERGSRPALVLTAGAAGVPLQQVINRALTSVASAQGRVARPVDVVPLSAHDRAGLSAFDLELGLLVPAMFAAVGLFLLGRRARLWVRVAGAAAYAVVAGAFAVVVLDAALGALTGAPWALFGDAAMVAGTLVMTIVALHCLLGLQGTAIATGALFIVGNAINGAAVPTRLLPGGYRQIAPWWPNNAAVYLVRSEQYFGGHGQSQPLTTLTVWLAAALVVIAVTDLVHLRARRAEPQRAAEIYGHSLIGSARARSRHQRADEPTVMLPSPELAGAHD